MRAIKSVMAPDGICVVVTPDVNSVAARLMGWKWWHFRAAHIGYFNKSTLTLALETAGLRVNAITRTWHLPSSYLAERAFKYLPEPFRPALPSILDRIVVPINLYDSLLVICGHSHPGGFDLNVIGSPKNSAFSDIPTGGVFRKSRR